MANVRDGGTYTSSASQRPASAQSGHSSHSSSSSSKHVKCIGRYVLTAHTLGKGNFARVEAAVHSLTRAKVAIKIIETDKIKEEYVKKNLLREAQLMRRLRHPNIIRLYETMKTNNLYCLVTEIAEGGELLSYVRNECKERRLPEATARPFVRQLTSALHYLHNHGIVHRDLKMENILLDKKKRHVKIVDFGLSNAQKPGALLQTHCGSPEYAAPELFIPGRQYGPEVDVWSLGVNMYAMLVGKLPFRSPRQGSRRRQKLLEQISAGITEHHENEMSHVSLESKDLIRHLLQPDSSLRIILDEVMQHPWITKDDTQPLKPYQASLPDPVTQSAVMELMQKVLGEPIGQIKETVRRDRCDWLAAIYHLLMDQPEGRSVLQRMLTDDPSDQLTSAADEYHTTAEHLSLSQNLSQSQHSQEQNEPADIPGILTKPIFPSKHNHDSNKSRGFINHVLMAPDGDIYNEHGEFNSSTLPLTKSEKKRHHGDFSEEYGTGTKGFVQHPSSAHAPTHHIHRYSMEFTSPRHRPVYQAATTSNRRSKNYDDSHSIHGYVHTPMPGPPMREAHISRPHSRLSAPEPIPVPFRKILYHNNYQSSNNYSNESPLHLSPSETPPPILDDDSLNRRRPGSLKNPMKRSLSGSIDTQLDAAVTGIPWKGKVQVGPYRRPSLETSPSVGWSNQTQYSTANQKMNGPRAPADIQSLMPQSSAKANRLVDTSNIVLRSSNSTEIKAELFSTALNNDSYGRLNELETKVNEKLQLESLPPHEGSGSLLMKNTRSHRSSSAKHPRHSVGVINSRIPELSTSAKHMADLEPLGPINGLKIPTHNELPQIDMLSSNNKESPKWKRSFSGKISKPFKKSESASKLERASLIMETPEIITDMQEN